MERHFNWGLDELRLAPQQLIRLPTEQDVSVTRRVRHLIDSSAMQRLRSINQLGLVKLVYPGAIHSRFEHSLGVFRVACLAVQHLHAAQPEVGERLSEQDVKTFLLASLLHDVGHWPYCHPIEDMRLPGVPKHEANLTNLIHGELEALLMEEWDVPSSAILDFLVSKSERLELRALQSLLNGPIDVDKMDYLQRDSTHAGVPYGKNFDASRLLANIRLDFATGRMAILEKGKTAAEMMVFSRYVMFSEVYWHHAVRSATAMVQRLVYRSLDHLDILSWSTMSDDQFERDLGRVAADRTEIATIFDGLFGLQRRLFKRIVQFNFFENATVHRLLARRKYSELVQCSELLADKLAARIGVKISADDILVDAPPAKLEVQFNLPVIVRGPEGPTSRMLADLSPVVNSLATEQFDSYVKRVRVFVAPDLFRKQLMNESLVTELLIESAEALPTV